MGRPDQQAGLIQSGKAKNITHAKVGLGAGLQTMCLSHSNKHSEASDGDDDDILIADDHDHDHDHERGITADGPGGREQTKEGHIAVKSLADAPGANHPFARSSSALNQTQKMIGSEKSVCSDSDEMTGLLGAKTVLSSDNSSSSSGGGGGDRDSRTSSSLETKLPYSAATTTAVMSYSLAQQPPIASVSLRPIKQQQRSASQQPVHPTQTMLKPQQSPRQQQQQLSPLHQSPAGSDAVRRSGQQEAEEEVDEDSKLWFPTALKPSAFFREDPSKTGTYQQPTHPIKSPCRYTRLNHLVNTPD